MKKENLINVGIVLGLSGMAVQGYYNFVIHSQNGLVYPLSIIVSLSGWVLVLIASRKKK